MGARRGGDSGSMVHGGEALPAISRLQISAEKLIEVPVTAKGDIMGRITREWARICGEKGSAAAVGEKARKGMRLGSLGLK